jgi:hypothetical protein
MGIMVGNIIAAIPITQTISKNPIDEKESDDTMAATPFAVIVSDEPPIIIGIRQYEASHETAAAPNRMELIVMASLSGTNIGTD